MKYCIFVLAHKNHLLLEKCLFQLDKYSTPGIPRYILLNNPTPEVQQVADKYKRNFRQYLFTGENKAGLATDQFIRTNPYDFYFKIDDDIMVATDIWDKKLFISWQHNKNSNPAYISCMIPVNGINWFEAVKRLGAEQEFKALFPAYHLDLNSAGAIWTDRNLALWLWKKVLQLKLKPLRQLRTNNVKYNIGLIGFERRIWELMGGFGPDDENKLFEFHTKNRLDYLIDDSVIAHHFSFYIAFDYMLEKLYPLIRDIEF